MPMRIIITVVANSNVPIFEGRVNQLIREGWKPRCESFSTYKEFFYMILSLEQKE